MILSSPTPLPAIPCEPFSSENAVINLKLRQLNLTYLVFQFSWPSAEARKRYLDAYKNQECSKVLGELISMMHFHTGEKLPSN